MQGRYKYKGKQEKVKKGDGWSLRGVFFFFFLLWGRKTRNDDEAKTV
jgi:hypothetical protein